MRLLVFLFAAAYAADLGDIGKLRCYTVQGRRNLTEKALTCGAPIPAEGNCSAFGDNRDTEVDGRRGEGAYREIGRRSDKVCSVSFHGRCGRKCGPIDKLCFTIVEKGATYPQALSECANRRGHLFIPDSDADLARLISSSPSFPVIYNHSELVGGKIKRFWMGGGTIFYRTCNRVKPNEDGVEPAVTYTIEDRSDREGVLGYVRTRLATEKFPYICAKSSADVPASECLIMNIAPPGPIITECKMQPTQLSSAPSIDVFPYSLGCIPGGPLRIGETLTFYMQIPASIWNFNLFDANYNVPFHFQVAGAEANVASYASNARKIGDWIGPIQHYSRFPYVLGSYSKWTIKNNPSQLLITVNDNYSFTFAHRTSRPNEDYVFLGGIRCGGLTNITVTNGGKLYGLPIDGSTIK